MEERFRVPGALKGDGAKRSLREEIYCTAVKFSPAGDAWAAASSQGLLVYALDASLAFDPFDLAEDVTPASIRYALAGEEWGRALLHALHLNESDAIREVLQQVPFDSIQAVSTQVPRLYLERLLQALCGELRDTAYLEYYVCWVTWLLKLHGQHIRATPRRYLPVLRAVQKCLLQHYNACRGAADSNIYTLRFLSDIVGRTSTVPMEEEQVEEGKEEETYGEMEVDESMTHF